VFSTIYQSWIDNGFPLCCMLPIGLRQLTGLLDA
jgi:hypothetical protein